MVEEVSCPGSLSSHWIVSIACLNAQNVSQERSSQDMPENSIIDLKDGTGTREIRTDTAEVPLQN